MKKRYHILTAVLVAAAIALCTLSLVSAYFLTQGQQTNTVLAGQNTNEISEAYHPPTEQTTGSNSYQKEISITNTGSAPCYIRVYADFSESSIRSRSFFSLDGITFYSAVRDLNDSSTYVSQLADLNPYWVFHPDDERSDLAGYYYYTIPVASGEATAPLFRYVRTDNVTLDDIRQYDIGVYAESIQVTGDNGSAYADYVQAWTEILGKS